MEYYHSNYNTFRRKKSKFNTTLRIILFVFIIGLAGGAYFVYQAVFSSNVWIPNEKGEFTIYIKPSDTFDDIKNQLYIA